MDLNKLTEKAQEAIVAAQREAEQRHNTQVEPEHLLYALIQQEGGVVPAVLDKIGVPPTQVSQRLQAILSRFARTSTPQQVYVSVRFRNVFEAAKQEAEHLKDDFVSTEHFLLAMVDESPLRELGVTRDRVKSKGNKRIRDKKKIQLVTGNE
jgi:ATP-dependent Clp protease ATP-binding subunit ClpB